MRHAIEWLLGLQRIRLAEDSPLSIRFATPPVAWIMLAGAVMSMAYIFYLYRHQNVSRRWRWMLGILRLGAVMSVLFMIGQPLLVLRRTYIDPSRVLVLVDRSASMAVADVDEPGESRMHPASQAHSEASHINNPETRWQAVNSALVGVHGLLGKLVDKQHVDLWTFADSAERIASIGNEKGGNEAAIALQGRVPDGARTNVAAALTKALQQSQGSRVAAAIILTDGRQTVSQSLDAAIGQAQARSIPVYGVSVGSDQAPRDVEIDSVWCEEDVFVQDSVAVRVRLEARGYENEANVELQLRDKESGELIQSQTAAVGGGTSRISQVDLVYRPQVEGRRTMTVSVVPTGPDEHADNNSAEFAVTAHDRKIGVLYVEGTPRFEYRYLKNLIIREETFDSSCLLLEATPGFSQEGTRPIQKFPVSMEELSRYDVVILGDVDPKSDEWLSPGQQTMLLDFVANLGGGVAFIAGEQNMPQRLRQTAIEKLLPVKLDSSSVVRSGQVAKESFIPQLTADGRQSPIFRLEQSSEAAEQTIAALPGWYWFAKVLGPQPAATVLAVHPTLRTESGPVPLAVLGRYGAGRTLYLGSDDLWRWRQYVGDAYYETVWLQAIRTLARGRKLGNDKPWRLETDRKRYELGEAVVVRLTAAEDGAAAGIEKAPVEVTDAANQLVDRIDLHPVSRDGRVLEGSFFPSEAGSLALSPGMDEMKKGGRNLTRIINVKAADPERDRTEADEELLRSLAARTGGQVLNVKDNLLVWATTIPDRTVEIPDDVEETLWDTPLMLMLLVGLLATEWIARRAKSLP